MDSQPEVSENLKFLTGYAGSRLRRFRPGNTESQVKRGGRRPGAGRPRTREPTGIAKESPFIYGQWKRSAAIGRPTQHTLKATLDRRKEIYALIVT